MPKVDPFTAHVAKAAKAHPAKAVAAALGKLIKARLTKPRPVPTQYGVVPVLGQAKAVRRSPRRLGRFRAYTPTTKPDVSRYGTFRKYMISTIRAHTDTRAANNAHATCDNPAFAKNKLDFNWAADNGYITFS